MFISKHILLKDFIYVMKMAVKKNILLLTVLAVLISLCLVFASCDSGSSDSSNPTPVSVTYTVSFNANGGSGIMASVDVENGTSCEIPPNGFTASAIDGLPNGVASNKKFFTGWNTEADGSGTAYVPGDTIKNVSSSITLYAQWVKPVFTVANNKKVYFSQGNLWYGKAGSATTATFNFENDQYSFQKEYDSDNWGNNNHISHFYWGKTESVAYAVEYSELGITTSDVFFANSSDFTVNGVTGQYRVLSKDEFQYLFNTSGTSGREDEKRFAICKYDTDKVGMLIFPDGWKVWPSDAGEEPTYNKTTWINCGSKTYSIDELNKLCAAGAIFLPATGYRFGSSIDCVGPLGYYWSAAAYEDGINYAYKLYFDGGDVSPAGIDYRGFGFSVRLVVAEN